MKRQIVIGDIHGCHDELQALLDKVGPTEDELIISVGDLIDRGPKPMEVVNFFKKNKNALTILGNHERKHLKKVYTYAQNITRLQLGNEYDQTLEWMRNLSYYYESKDVIVVHAAFIPGVKMDKQPEEVLCRSTSGEKHLDKLFNGEYWHKFYEGEKPVVFGHHFVGDEPMILKDKIYGIDTGACHGGYLTAVTIPDFKVYRVKSKEDYWSLEKTKWQKQVIMAHPWRLMQWEQIQSELRRIRRSEDREVVDLIAHLEAWVQELRELVPKISSALECMTKQMLQDGGEAGFYEFAKNHCLREYLFACCHGRLTVDMIGKRCATPDKTIGLAKMLGIEAKDKPLL